MAFYVANYYAGQTLAESFAGKTPELGNIPRTYVSIGRTMGQPVALLNKLPKDAGGFATLKEAQDAAELATKTYKFTKLEIHEVG